MRRFAFFLFALVGACGPAASTPDAGADAGYGKKPIDAGAPAQEAGVDCDQGNQPSTTYPAAHPPLPQLVTAGGPVLAHPRFVPVVFAGDARTSDIGAFMSAVGTSSYWTSVASEYGVGPATATAPIVVDETPPAQLADADIRAWLAQKLDGTHADFGTPDSSSIYVVYYPSTTTITTASGDSCIGFGGYHSQAKVGATDLVYAVIAQCPYSATTSITSHELFEAATDPYYYSAPAYRGFANAAGWNALSDEIGDACEGNPDVTPADVGYPVPPVWSNAAAAAGHWACVPNDGAPNFRTMPDQASLSIAAGGSATIQLRAFSDQPTAPWTVSVSQSNTNWEERLGLTLCRTTAENGESIPLTITRPSTAHSNTINIVSKLGDVTTYATLDVGD